MDCLFCAIIEGTISSNKVYEDDKILAFHDINPQAPVHVIVIPKKHMASLDEISDENIDDVAALMSKIPEIAKLLNLENGYRLVSNCGSDACQSVKHLHFHILGGKQLADKMS
ncbi:MAG: histidine triad nucleotide-binding protein [Clostridia bacterium]|nr:histidine triad nucleotide-binding protein [Clostridia bacterium]